MQVQIMICCPVCGLGARARRGASEFLTKRERPWLVCLESLLLRSWAGALDRQPHLCVSFESGTAASFLLFRSLAFSRMWLQATILSALRDLSRDPTDQIHPSLTIAMASTKTCYMPNGESRNGHINVTEGWVYAPCDNTADVSMCCAIGPGRADGTQDTCLENGLCQNNQLLWRESCTDPTWEDPACIKLFLNGTGFNETEGTSIDRK
jgi:hypothetical protein